jgi:hypothetical protein
MAGTTVASLNGVFKQAYAEGIEDLIPKSSILQKEIDFKLGTEKLGDKFNQPVVVANELGITFGGSAGSAFNLNNPISVSTQNALVPGVSMVLRSSLSYDAAAKASSNVNAFVDSTSFQMENMVESMSKFVEIELIYGSSVFGLGTLASVTYAGSPATTATLTFNAQQWAAGIWSGFENGLVDIFAGSSSGVTGSSPLNSVGPITVTAVSVASKTLTVSGAAADLVAIAASATNAVVYFYGAFGNEIQGLDYLISTVGTVNNINNVTWNLWQGNVYNVGNVGLTTALVGSGLALAQARGLMEDTMQIISPASWVNLNTSLVTNNRKFDYKYSTAKAEDGSEVIQYYTQSGVVDIHSHIYVKEGESYNLPTKRAKRIGAQDISFQIPGSTEGEIFLQLPNAAGFEYRLYTNQGMLLTKPAACTKFYNIAAV